MIILRSSLEEWWALQLANSIEELGGAIVSISRRPDNKCDVWFRADNEKQLNRIEGNFLDEQLRRFRKAKGE